VTIYKDGDNYKWINAANAKWSLTALTDNAARGNKNAIILEDLEHGPEVLKLNDQVYTNEKMIELGSKD